MSHTILSMPNVLLNHSYNDKYTFSTVHSTWYVHKWYRYEYYDICTFGAPVEEWERLIKDVNRYLEIYSGFSAAMGAIGALKTIFSKQLTAATLKALGSQIMSNITKAAPVINKIAAVVEITSIVV